MTNNILYIADGNYGVRKGRFTPLMQGQYGQSVSLEIRNLANDVSNLTGYTTITAALDDRRGNVYSITGTIALDGTPSTAPQATWTIDEDDTGLAGTFDIVFTFSNGSAVLETLPVTLVIYPNPEATASIPSSLVGISTAQKALLASLMTLTGLANFDGAGAASEIKIKLDGTTAPTVNEDSGDGYGVMSIWVDTTNDNIYICTDATLGAANWEQVNGGGGLSNVVEDTTPQLGGDLDLNGNDITGIDPTGLETLTATTLSGLVAESDALFLKARSTGILYGGAISDQGSGVVRIAAGEGGILDNSTPQTPDYTRVTWSQTDLDLSAVDTVYYVYVNAAGTVTSTTTAPSHDNYRTAIWLHRVSILSGVYSASTPIVQPLQQYGPQIWDIWRAYGHTKRNLELSAASTNLTIAVAAGEFYDPGSNFYTDPTNPNETAFTTKSPATFRHVLQDGTQGSDVTALDVGNYDVSGTLTAIPGAATRATIFTVKMFAGNGGRVRIFYGQSYYVSVAAALDALQNGTYAPVTPSIYDEAITLGWIIAEKGATNLADGTQVFVTSNKFGLTGGGIASNPSGIYLLASNDLSDVNDAATARANIGAGTGNGDVTGPGSSTDNLVPTFNSTTGKVIQANHSAVTIDDTGKLVATVPMSSYSSAASGQAFGDGATSGASGAALGYQAAAGASGVAVGRGNVAASNHVSIGYQVITTGIAGYAVKLGNSAAPGSLGHFWNYDGVDGTARTVMPNGTGDVLYGVGGMFFIRDSAGNIATGTITATAPSSTFNLYDDGGTNTCQLQVAADGSITVQRTAGTRTYKVNLNLIWL